MAELFGHPEAYNQAIMDKQSIQMNQLSMQKSMLGLEAAKLDLDQQKKMVSLMKGADFKDKDPAGLMTELARMELESGNEAEGSSLLDKAVTYTHVKSEAEQAALKTSFMRLTQAEKILSNVKDADSWEQAKKLAKAQGLDKDPAVQQLLQLPYNPLTVGLIHDTVVSQKDKATIDYDKARKKEQESLASLNEEKLHTEKARQKRLEQLTRDHGKNGSATGLAPKATLVKEVGDLIDGAYRGLSKADRDLYSRQIAEDAQALRKQDPSLTETAAASKAFAQAKAEKRITGATSVRVRPGTKPANPLPIPPKATADQLIDNMWYTIPSGEFKGQAGLWSKKDNGFIPETYLRQAEEDDGSTDDSTSSDDSEE